MSRYSQERKATEGAGGTYHAKAGYRKEEGRNQTTNEPAAVDVAEWNEEVSAFLRPLTGFETLVMNDYFLTFYNKELDEESRFDALFCTFAT